MEAFTRLRLDIGEIAAHRTRDVLAQGGLQRGFVRSFGAQQADGIHEGWPLGYSNFLERPVRSSKCTRG
jgi:hypothetical protein